MKLELPILAIETTGELCSIALMIGENLFYELNILKKYVHSEKIFGMISTVFETAELKIEESNAVAVSIGPGSFTGLRIGMAAAKSIAFAAGKPIIPVPTFKALAFQINETTPPGTRFGILKKASIDDYYFAEFQSASGNAVSLGETSLISSDLLSRIADSKILLFGDSAGQLKAIPLTGPAGQIVCRWSYLFGNDLLTFDYDYMEPFYLKKFVARVKK